MNIGACDYKSNSGIVAAFGDKSVLQARLCQLWGLGGGSGRGRGRHLSGLACLSLWPFLQLLVGLSVCWPASLSGCVSASLSVRLSDPLLACLPGTLYFLPYQVPGLQKYLRRCRASSHSCSSWRDTVTHLTVTRGMAEGWMERAPRGL